MVCDTEKHGDHRRVKQNDINSRAVRDMRQNRRYCRVTVNLEAMRHWAMQYARHATVLSPRSLVETVAADLKEAVENYRSFSC